MVWLHVTNLMALNWVFRNHVWISSLFAQRWDVWLVASQAFVEHKIEPTWKKKTKLNSTAAFLNWEYGLLEVLVGHARHSWTHDNGPFGIMTSWLHFFKLCDCRTWLKDWRSKSVRKWLVFTCLWGPPICLFS